MFVEEMAERGLSEPSVVTVEVQQTKHGLWMVGGGDQVSPILEDTQFSATSFLPRKHQS